jgi:hypothetical protein
MNGGNSSLLWQRLQDGQLTWSSWQRKVKPIEQRVKQLLLRAYTKNDERVLGA